MSLLPFDAALVMGPTYASCLRAMNAAVRQGVGFDIPPEFASLVGLDPVTLEELISIERAFASKALTHEGEVRDWRENHGARESVRTPAPQGMSGVL